MLFCNQKIRTFEHLRARYLKVHPDEISLETFNLLRKASLLFRLEEEHSILFGSTIRQQADTFGRSESTIVKCRRWFMNAVIQSIGPSILSFDHWNLKHSTAQLIPHDDYP